MNDSLSVWNVTEDLEKDIQDVIPQKDILYLTIRYSLFISSAICDALIIYFYYRIKKLKIPDNKLIIHWAGTNLYYYLHHLIITDVICFAVLKLEFTPKYLISLSTTALVINYVFGLAMLVRWIVLNFNYKLSKDLKELLEEYFVYFIYSLGFTIYMYEYFYYKYHTYEVAIMCLDSIILTSVVINIIIYVYKIKSNSFYVIYVANTIIASLVPMVLYHYLFLFLVDSSSVVLDVVFYTRIVPQVIMFSCSIVVCVVLYKTSKDFNIAFKVIIGSHYSHRAMNNDWVFIEDVETV